MKSTIITLLMIGGVAYVVQKRGGKFGLIKDDDSAANGWFDDASKGWFDTFEAVDTEGLTSWMDGLSQSIKETPVIFKDIVNDVIHDIEPVINPPTIFDKAVDNVLGDKSLPRGIRNNNPGNIEYTGTPWKGLASPPSDGRFVRFTTAQYGLRALARLLMNYQIKYGLNTVKKIIDRWAPPVENNTSAYASAVARHLGVGVSEKINVRSHLHKLVAAIVQHENGRQPYTATQINNAIKIMGI